MMSVHSRLRPILEDFSAKDLKKILDQKHCNVRLQLKVS